MDDEENTVRYSLPKNFGLPFVLSAPKNLSKPELYEKVLDRVK
jgi:hypothetical protein